MKKIHYILLIILAIVAIVRVFYEYNVHKDELAATQRFESRQKAVTKKGAPKVQMVNSVNEIEKIFNDNLPSCTPINVATEDNTNYVIYGMDGDKCSFEKYSNSLCLQCLVSKDVAEKYSRAWIGFDSFVNEVNNDPKYCKIITPEQDKKDKKDKKNKKDKKVKREKK